MQLEAKKDQPSQNGKIGTSFFSNVHAIQQDLKTDEALSELDNNEVFNSVEIDSVNDQVNSKITALLGQCIS